ncbi:MAG TPA: hypothetical protein VIN10_07020 [Bacteroidales bacterium]
MKKYLSLLVLVIGLIIVSPSKAQAQYPIPSYQVELMQVNATFEENENTEILSPINREESQLTIEVGDPNPLQVSWVIVNVYSLDGQDVLGPYTVMEGSLLSVAIDDRAWGVKVVNCLEGAILSVWIE